MIVGCTPRGVIPPAQMEELLYDLHKTEGILQASGYSVGRDEVLNDAYQSILDKHGITQAEFDSSLMWYTNNPKIFEKIYPRVLERLQTDLDEISALAEATSAMEKGISLATRQKVNEQMRIMRKGLRYDMPQWADYQKHIQQDVKPPLRPKE